MNKWVADFLRDNILLVKAKSFEELYSMLERQERKELTEAFMAMGIDPLRYMTAIPKGYASTTGVSNLRFAKNLECIGAKAFSNCSEIETLKIPDGCTLIGVMAFYGCYNLTTIYLPGTIERICSRAFYCCDGLEEIYYNGTVEEWKETIDVSECFPSSAISVVTVHCKDGDILLQD